MESKEVHRIAHLARVELGAEEEVRFAGQLTSILGYFQKLQELDTTDVVPASHPADLPPHLRPDASQAFPAPERLVRAAARSEGPFFQVPRVLD